MTKESVRTRLPVTVFSVLMSLLFPPVALAQSVYIQAREAGQGLSRRVGNECFVLAPEHVIAGATIVSLSVGGIRGILAEVVTTFADDLAALRITSGRLNCKPWDVRKDFSTFLVKQNEAVVQTLNPDGSISKRFVRLAEVESRYALVRPASVDDELFQGLSGSAVLAGGELVGMLQSVDATTGAGNVLTLPYIEDLSRQYFSSATASSLEAVTPANEVAADLVTTIHPANSQLGAAFKFYKSPNITKSSLPPGIARASPPSKLTDGVETTYSTWPAYLLPIAIDIAAPGNNGVLPVSGIALKMPVGVDPRNYVQVVSVMAGDDSGSFREIKRANLKKSAAYQLIEFDTISFETLRISFLETWGGGDAAISEISIFVK
jgi:hypothetical protein